MIYLYISELHLEIMPELCENVDDILDSFVIGLDKNEFISACKKKFYKSAQI